VRDRNRLGRRAVQRDLQRWLDWRPGRHELSGAQAKLQCAFAICLAAVAVMVFVVARVSSEAAASGSAEPRGVVDSGTRQQRPNVLLVITDDQTKGTVNPKVMPNVIRYLVAGGRTFSNFFIPDPLCCPSRAAIMSGRYNHNNGVIWNGPLPVAWDIQATMQCYLQRAGYLTWISGKFLNSWHYDAEPPCWDHALVTTGGKHTGLPFNEDGRYYLYPRYAEPLIADRASRYLASTEQLDSQPWFGYLSFTVPHGPYSPMRPYNRLRMPQRPASPAERESDISDKWPGYRSVARQPGQDAFERATWTAQEQMLQQADGILGWLFAQLQWQHELANTMVIYLSDNGFLFGAHRLTGKRLPYSEAIHVPAFIRWPGHVPPNSRSARFSMNVDLLPTVLEAAGIDLPVRQPLDGHDLLDPHWRRRRMLFEHWRIGPGTDRRYWQPSWLALRTASYEYIEYTNASRTSVIFREYYDLLDDPFELDNVLADDIPSNDPDIAALHAALEKNASCIGSGCPGG
jgi:arylsulfatase A-like enzyme